MSQRIEKILQFGEGGFLRGFVDWIVQVTNEASDFNAGVVVVQPIAQGMCDRLEAQGCRYTHVMRGLKDGAPRVEKKVIDAITRTVQPYQDYDAYLALAQIPSLRFVVSNTTEAGISYESGDCLADRPPKSFPAKVTALLYRRWQSGLPGFVFLPCELIDQNGATLKQIVLRYAREWHLEEAFLLWVEQENRFCNTLVDRIVTGYPKEEKIPTEFEDNMLNTSELFHLWVIEGYPGLFREFPMDKAGLNVILTDQLERYRTRKVRILNGAHTSMIPYALLRGVQTVGECMQDPTLSEFLHGCVTEEILPTLDLPQEELEQYAQDVFERFSNPFIRHLCASISLNSVSKFKVRVLPSLLEYKKRKGVLPRRLVFSLAKLIEFYKKGEPNDDPRVVEFIQNNGVYEILKNRWLWDEDLSFMTDEVSGYVDP